MIQEIIKYSFRFLILVLLQVLIFKNIYLGRFIILLPYIIFIIALPFSANRLLVIGLALVLGFTVDLFYDTEGIFAASAVLVGFLRYFILNVLAPRDGFTDTAVPSSQTMGWAVFLAYAGILIFAHHFLFFYLEVFRFYDFFTTLLKVLLSSVFTLILVVVIQFLFYRNQSSIY
jgi:hypothetical protein